FLRELANRAISNGQVARYTVLALSVPDIVDLLPVEQVLSPRAKPWPDLRREHRDSARSREDFKTWAADVYGDRAIWAQRLADVALTLQSLPPDIQRLADALVTN